MIDDIGYKILGILQRKARIPNVEVARQVNMAPSAVLERIRKLESQGYIDGYEVRLNPRRFNRPLVVFVFVEIRDLACRTPVGRALSQIPAIQEVHFIAGPDRFLVKLRVADADELDHLLQEDIARIDGINRTGTHIVLSTIKETANIPIGETT
ncbi:MAG: Lrp/AsnC family transcriptional regulator [Deltaproteobacteria bacterium]|jgi:Lrp/AsnC family leucine-responsive transcriptional regulator|nr:Lrp/AsnC family transcriptional regulator [Deltaproteobacteria bacterium]